MGKKSKPGQAGAKSNKPVKLTSGLKLKDLAVAPAPRQHNAFKDLKELYKRASDQLLEYSSVGLMLIEKGYLPRLTEEEHVKARSLCALLKRDVENYSLELGTIRKQAESVEREGEIMDAFNLGNRYVQIIDSMNATMVPIAQDISNLIRAVDEREGKA